MAQAVRTVGPDVLMVTEYRHRAKHRLAERLAEIGLAHQIEDPDLAGNHTGMLTASRHPLTPGDVVFDSDTDNHRFRHVVVRGWDVVSAYIPGKDAKANRKEKYWQFLVEQAGPVLAQRKCLITGDLNTGLHYRDELGATLVCANHMQALFEAGWRDAWVERNPRQRPPGTWISNTGNPFRLDHAFLSPAAPKARVDYPLTIGTETVWGRGGLSDHLPVVVRLP